MNLLSRPKPLLPSDIPNKFNNYYARVIYKLNVTFASLWYALQSYTIVKFGAYGAHLKAVCISAITEAVYRGIVFIF